MNRRGFLARLFAAPIVALAVLRAPTEPQWMHDLVSFGTPVEPSDLGISIRFIRQWDMATAQHPTRFDVLYGTATLTPEFAVRATAHPWWSPRRWIAA